MLDIVSHLSCFNPSVGILFVHTREQIMARTKMVASFNPSVGILFVHTPSFVTGGILLE